MLVVCATWIGYVALPYVLSWGPVLLVVIASVVFALAGRRRAGSMRTP